MRILLCDDHALFRDGLELVLGQLDPTAELVGVSDAESAFARLAASADFDLMLLDLALPGMDGMSALERLRAEHPALPVVVLSASEQPKDARAALDLGAAGFIPKTTGGTVLLGALHLVLSGGVYVPPLLLGPADAEHGTSRTTATRGVGPEAHGLTPRQLEVLRLLAGGLTNREICDTLGIAEGTVKAHLQHIYEVLDVTNRTEAAKVMRDLGLDG